MPATMEKISESEDLMQDYAKILKMTNLSMKMYANIYYKTLTYLEPSDIEEIKKALNNYRNQREKIEEFKQDIIFDLTEFQQQIKNNHTKKIVDWTKKKLLYEKQISILIAEKENLIKARISQLIWPYDRKTKSYDTQIKLLKIKAQKCVQKAVELQSMRPAADERDILLYQMHLKDKYSG